MQRCPRGMWRGQSGYGRSALLFGLALIINAALFILLPWLTRVQHASDHMAPMSVSTKVTYSTPSICKQEEQTQETRERTRVRRPEQALPQVPMAFENPPDRSRPRIKVQPLQAEGLMPQLHPASIEIEKPKPPVLKPAAEAQPAVKQPKPEQPAEHEQRHVEQKAGSPPVQSRPPQARSETFALGEVDQRPRPIKKINPVYPFKARRQNIEGTVMLECLVDSKGKIKEIRVVSAEPEGIFEASAKEALQHWRFRPGKVNGRAVTTRIRLPFRFQLQ